MLDWIAATLAGTGLGLALFGCVRLRMHIGPIIRNRFGKWARRVYWLVTILVMVLLANLGLLLLRIYLSSALSGTSKLMLETWFALLALAVALGLIFRRLKTDNCEPAVKE